MSKEENDEVAAATTTSNLSSNEENELTLKEKKKGLHKIMKKLREQRAHCRNNARDTDERMVRFSGPYSDSAGAKFFLPKEYCHLHQLVGHGKKKSVSPVWHEANLNYKFNKEMNDSDLMQKLGWLGDSNDLIKKISSLRCSEEEEELVDETDDDEEEGEEDEYDEDEGDYHRKKEKTFNGQGSYK